jgi:hypothetical protein
MPSGVTLLREPAVPRGRRRDLGSAPQIDVRDVTMKRTDAFVLALTAFIFANCISYFERSGEPYVTGWGMLRPGANDIQEAIGFPLKVYGLAGGFLFLSWINCLGDLVIALTASGLSSVFLAKRLPPLWPGQSRAFRYSLRALLSGVTVFCLLLGIAITSRSLGLIVRSIVCFGGPSCTCAWLLYRRQVAWVPLGIVAVGFTLITLAVDFHYQDPPIDGHMLINAFLPFVEVTSPEDWSQDVEHAIARMVVGLTMIRASVPVLGLVSLFVIASAAHCIIRQYVTVYGSRDTNPPST